MEDALKSLCAFRLTLNIPVSKTTVFETRILRHDQWVHRLIVESHEGYTSTIAFLFDPQRKLADGIVGKSALERPTQLANDVKDEQWAKIYVKVTDSTRTQLAVPLLDERGVLGVLNIEDSTPHAFTPHDRALVEMFGMQAVIAMHIVDLVRRPNRKVYSLKSLSFIIGRIRGIEEEDVIIRMFMVGISAKDGLGFSRAIWFSYDPANRHGVADSQWAD